MSHLIFCVSGFSGTGKDEVCKRLVSGHGAVHTGMADPAKRHMAEIYGFSEERLFGPSKMRNFGDRRFPKPFVPGTQTEIFGSRLNCPETESFLVKNFPGYVEENSYGGVDKNWWATAFYLGSALGPLERNVPRIGNTFYYLDTDPTFFLSPREALQQYCDKMNTLYENTWIRLGVETHKKLAEVKDDKYTFKYSRMRGLVPDDGTRTLSERTITCFSDFRHRHEIKYVKENQDGFRPVTIRVKRPGIESPPFDHRSETEQATIPDSAFDFVINNDGTIEDLYGVVDAIVAKA